VSPTAIVLACSGPGAGRIISESIRIAHYCAAFGFLVLLVIFYFQRFRAGRMWPLSVSIALLVIHPAWTVSAVSGDCGDSKREASYFVSFLLVGLLLYQIYASHRSRQSA